MIVPITETEEIINIRSRKVAAPGLVRKRGRVLLSPPGDVRQIPPLCLRSMLPESAFRVHIMLINLFFLIIKKSHLTLSAWILRQIQDKCPSLFARSDWIPVCFA
jgi:hypothetical protein